jgi:hypothetical protein
LELKQQILDAMKAAMKDRDQVRVAALRLVRDAIQKAEINERLTLDDAGVLMVLARLEKQRQESIEAYKAGNRADLVEREQKELEIIRGFMPPALLPEELTALVRSHLEATGAASAADLGTVMKSLKGHYEGRVSGKDLSAEVKRQLAAKTGP